MFYTLIWTLSVTSFCCPLPTDSPDSWRPFDHPSVSTRTFSAFTRPGRALTVSSDIPQRVQQVLFDEGETVPGPFGSMVPIILLDSSVEMELLEGARIALGISKNEEVRAELSARKMETTVRIIRRDLQRVRELHSRGDASESALDRAILAEEEAQVSLEIARVSRTDAASTVLAAASRVAVMEARIDKLTLKAPAGWRVEQRLTEPGAGVVPGAPLMVFVDLSYYEIEIPMAEDEIQVLSTSPLQIQRVSSGASIAGTVQFVAAIPDLLTKRRRVVIQIAAEEIDLELLESGGGIELKLSLEVPDSSGGVRIPARFLGRRLEQWVLKTEDGRLHVVTPVRSDGDGWIVLAGDLPAAAVIVEP
ncbi:MAG: HlyD family efflux transporter periplasmic adaptor subunit [Planctomycetota bacterium]|nr:HlyD family efflux transporter periplasmic adaptor subunit [Planctomycetota bacterium]